MYQKKKIGVMLITLLLLFAFPFSVYAGSEKNVSFYVKRNSEHRQPALDPCFSYMEKYDCFYVDKSCTEGGKEKKLYLTFDAGYENGNIEKILDILKEEEVTGAFFVLAHLVQKNTALVKRMAEEGHTVANHTAYHPDMSQIHEKEAFLSELQKMERIYREATGYELSKFYRPPEGRVSEENLRFLEGTGYKTVMWSFAYDDWDNGRQPNPEKAKKKIFDNTHNGAILLFHPTSSTNASILQECIQKWKKEGYHFGSLEELTNEIS